MDGYVEALGISRRVRVRIGLKRIEFSIAGSMFGLINSNLTIAADEISKPSEAKFMVRAERLELGDIPFTKAIDTVVKSVKSPVSDLVLETVSLWNSCKNVARSLPFKDRVWITSSVPFRKTCMERPPRLRPVFERVVRVSI